MFYAVIEATHTRLSQDQGWVIYVAQLTKNELLNFSLFSKRLFSPKSLRLEFNNGFKISQTIF